MCRKSLLLFFLLTGLTRLFAQYSVAQLMQLKPVFIPKYENNSKVHTVTLKMDFNSPVVLNPADAAVLQDKSILRVELYYTAFQLAESFSQPKLNKERYASLQKLCPGLFKQNSVEWKIIGQSACKNPLQAKNYFHGFVITYSADGDSGRDEAKTIADILHNDSLGHDTLIVNITHKYRKTKKRSGYYLPRLKSKRDKGIRYTHKGIWDRKPEYYTRVDTLIHKNVHREFIRSGDAASFMKRLPDSTIFKVLDRHEAWKNILFVCDVTGSMAPYTAEVMLWHKLNYQTNKAKYFTFFNDGDNMPDHKKKIGRTGGIYFITATNFVGVEIALYNTMRRGGGGDIPENNCEAIIRSLQQMGDAGEIVMIADNLASIKDLALADQIKRPVRIILCGAEKDFINPDHLELARKTKGSVHSMSEDLENLYKLAEGEVFTFGKKQFKIVKGKVIALNPALAGA